ncbi:conjugative transfer protein MobI(A/C) [Xenorhabdus szentirmaii]|uniref:conjugative transfer protein MobI(A/C) n=1 Tax=Xenorhabdus szentirmaii TaxID=290112 RepID=UPI002B4142FF|nr:MULTISPECIES: conjugative transfer protein MobI(A/C) [unclassified Xenorhabdus]
MSLSPKKNSDGFNVISHYLPRESHHRYSKATFTRSQDWEKPIIEIAEDSFAIIRRANANLMRMRQLCHWSENKLFEMIDGLNELQ